MMFLILLKVSDNPPVIRAAEKTSIEKMRNKFNNKLGNLVMLTLREHIEVHKLMRREMVFKDQLALM